MPITRAILLLVSLALSACQTTQSDDPSSLSFRVPAGSTRALNKVIEIPDGLTHAFIQSGQLITESKRDQYDLGCRLNFKEFGPRTIAPEVFNIRRTEDREGWESRPNFYFYATEVFLDSDKNTDVIKLECDIWAMPPSTNFSYADIQRTLGDYLTFKFKSPYTPEQ
jgi:hypothetical protein